MIADLLAQHGVRKAFLCPGSRNAPLIVAIHRYPELQAEIVVDERSAAFMALGYASLTGQPVAVVCTSGSAVLNFAPAVAEAFYRRVPLIVISADRPAEWIDQDDSQTIRQIGVLRNIVKESYNVPVETGNATQAWHINRTLNDAMLMAQSLPQGPVHINVQLDAPLGQMAEGPFLAERKISVVRPTAMLPTREARALAAEIASPRKVLVIAGFMPPNGKVNTALLKLAAKPNVAVLHEAQANLHGGRRFIGNIDSVLSILSAEEKEQLAPDVVITIGGSLVSRFVKAWLRQISAQHRGVEHWHVGLQPYSVDCFMGLTRRIEMETAPFLQQLASGIQPHNAPSDYSALWRSAADAADAATAAYLKSAPWSDFLAMGQIIKHVPRGWNVQLSNGTAVRYAQLFDYGHIHRIDCNRGVSGIDGSASTAIGAALAYQQPTMLISGDMSAQYDLGALAAKQISQNFKMAVLNNQGGGIFRFVASTAELEEREEFFCQPVNLPLRELARAFGFEYLRAKSDRELATAWHLFADSTEPAILEVVTDGVLSAEVLKQYFQRPRICKS